jgi:lipoate-protein ligase A
MNLEIRRCRLVEYACLDGDTNMAVDRALFDMCECDPDSAFVRFYSWSEPTLSMGHFEPADAVDAAAALGDGVAVVRRPTGGRVVLHGDDLTYTVVLPGGDHAAAQGIYRLVSEILVEGLAALGAPLDIRRGRTGRSSVLQKPCFASVSRHEVTYRGRKVIGSAQRCGRRAVLQHGSIPLGPGYMDVVKYMNVPESAREALAVEMAAGTACLKDVLGRSKDPGDVALALGSAFRSGLNCDFSDLALEEIGGVRVGWSVHAGLNPSDKSP